MAPAQGWHAKSWSVPHFLAALPVSFNRCNLIWCLFFKVLKNEPKLADLWKSWGKHPCRLKSSTYSYLFGFKLICWFDGCTLCSHPTMNHIWNIVKKTFIMWNSARHAKTTISAIYCLGIWCLIFSNFNVLASAVHILKLERYRED